jgi:predicted dehydrogenase
MHKQGASRRRFLHQLGLTGLSFTAMGTGLPGLKGLVDPLRLTEKEGKLGVALVGLGGYSTGQLAPALQQTEHCYLAGIVTGTASKIPTWVERYNIPDKNIYNYENFDSIKDNKDIDIVYVVLPNSMHAEYTIRAAKAGKHVICEKPMALSVEDCNAMINACKKAGKMLSIGYRLHFEPYNLEMVRLGTRQVYGQLQSLDAAFGFTMGNPNQWRVKKALSGGGPLQDLGIYCINGICYTSGKVPISVKAVEGPKTDPVKFAEVEQSLSWEFELPGGIIANAKCSYADNYNFLTAKASGGEFGLTSAYNYGGQKGFTPAGNMDFPRINQQAKQMDDFALCIKNKKQTIVPGELGRRDVHLIQSVYEAMATGKRISIKPIPDK